MRNFKITYRYLGRDDSYEVICPATKFEEAFDYAKWWVKRCKKVDKVFLIISKIEET